MAKQQWVADSNHSNVGFKIRHLMITYISGKFNNFTIDAETTEEDFMTAQVIVSIDVDAISTGSPDRDYHLRSPEFFDVNKFRHITFVSSYYKNVDGDGSYELFGDLTIRDITKRIQLDVEFGGVIKDPWGNTRAGFTINGKINRKDFGLNWNATAETGGILISEDVKICCEVQLIKK